MRFARLVPLCIALLAVPAVAEFPYPTNPPAPARQLDWLAGFAAGTE